MLTFSRPCFLPSIPIIVLATLIGCSSGTVWIGPGSGNKEDPELSDEALPDFSTADVNADSARYLEAVSPRDYLGQISAWYFGSST